MPGGNLYDYLHKYHNKLDLAQILKMAIDVSKGMDYLHQHNIIHRDLKSANLLIDSDQVLYALIFSLFYNDFFGKRALTETFNYNSS